MNNYFTNGRKLIGFTYCRIIGSSIMINENRKMHDLSLLSSNLFKTIRPEDFSNKKLNAYNLNLFQYSNMFLFNKTKNFTFFFMFQFSFWKFIIIRQVWEIQNFYYYYFLKIGINNTGIHFFVFSRLSTKK